MTKIAELPGWGPKSARNLADAAHRIASNGVSLARFIYSLGIRHAGQHTSKLIASTYGTADAFLSAAEAVSDKDEDNFLALVGTNETEGTKGIGPAQVSSLISFARESDSLRAARELAAAIQIIEDPVSVAVESAEGKPWQGFTVVFTGTLPNGLSRSRAQELARQLGAKATPGTVSKSTNIVVAGEKGGKKLDQAVKLGVQVMDATEFISLVQEHELSTL